MISRRGFLAAGTAAAGLALVQPRPATAGTATPVAQAAGVPWTQLSRHLHGTLVLPADPAYAVAKQLELMQFDAVSPKAVAYCADSSDVSLAVRFAQWHRLPVAVRSGGHSYGGYSTGPGLVIDVSRIDTVAVAPGTGTAGTVTLGPGAMNVDVLNTLAPYGLVVSEGGCPTVAVGGFLQGGGFGLLTRSYGMACDAITAATVVLADGSVVTASPTEHPDLFWALRGGGGGNFGVVTSYTVTPHRLDQLATCNLVFAYDRAPEVLDGFTRWLADAPHTIGGGAYIDLPDAAPGAAPALTVTLASTGPAAELGTQVDRLRQFTGAPVNRQDGAFTYQALMTLIFGCGGLTPEQCRRAGKTTTGQLSRPAFGVERTRLCTGPFARAGWDGVVSAYDADRAAGHARRLEVHMFGGAANEPGRTDTAYVHRDALFSVNYRDIINDPAAATAAARAAATSWVGKGFAAIDPYSNGETFQNWMDPALTDWKRAYYAENYPRLSRIKARYDPGAFFRFPQGVTA